jgi:hypothetical protein
MWGQLLVLALVTTFNPVRLGIVLLVLSRPRPMQNLLAYWVGAVIVGLTTLIVPLIALRATPTSTSFAENFAQPTANPTAQRIMVGIGLVLVLVAALMVVRSLAQSRGGGGRSRRSVQNARSNASTETTTNANTSTLVLDSTAPPILSRLLGPSQDEATEGGSAIRRLLRRVRTAWQNGSPWISFVIGIMVLPPLDGVILALAVIVASGAAIGIQVSAVIIYMIGALVVEEVILVSNLIAPTKTHAALRRLHECARAHHRKFVAAILALIGLSMVIRGMGGY